MTTSAVMPCPTRSAMIALAAAMTFLSSAAQATPAEGIYTCRPESLQIVSPRAPMTWASAEGEVGIEVAGGQVEIYHIELSANPGGLHAPLTLSLDPAMRAVGPLRPLISSFEVPVGLLVGRDAVSAPAGAAGWFLADFVAGGISATLSGQLPASPQGTRFAMDLACVPVPPADVLSYAFTRINEAQDRLCSIIELANRDLARFDANPEQITPPAPCEAPPAADERCTEASCMCLCIGFDDCVNLVLSDSCQPFVDVKCNSLGPFSCTCPMKDCVLGPIEPF